jgi:hypothetical protein
MTELANIMVHRLMSSCRIAKGRLTLQAQPAYPPELNPEERIWK